MTAPIAIIFGAGPNVGVSVAKKFSAQGYTVIGVARTPKDELKGAVTKVLPADLTKPEAVDGIFQQVEQEFGPPSVIFYNGLLHTFQFRALPV